MKAVAKFLVAFDKAAMSKFGKLDFNGTFLEVATRFTPAEYSVEIAYIVDIPPHVRDYKKQLNREKSDVPFKKGDKVLVMYDVYIRGRYPELSKTDQSRKIAKGHDLDPEKVDSDVYFAEWSEVMARFEGEELVAAPGRVLVHRPKFERNIQTMSDKTGVTFADISGTVVTESGIVAPQIAIPDADLFKSPFWGEVAYDTEDYKKGDLIFISGGMFTPLTYNDLLAVHTDSVMAKKITEKTNQLC